MNKKLVAKILIYKFGYEPEIAESIAADLIRDDFKKNAIRTPGGAIAFIDALYDRMHGNNLNFGRSDYARYSANPNGPDPRD